MSDRFGKFTFYGNPFIGLYARTNNQATIIGVSAPDKFARMADLLGTNVFKATFAESPLVGLYCIMNSRGILISEVAEDWEVNLLKKSLKDAGLDMNVRKMKSNFTAIGNNIALNDSGALLNPDMADDAMVKEISDMFEVDVMAMTIAGYKTVGAAVAVTNKGFVTHPHISEEEMESLKMLFKVEGGVGTVNGGMPFMGMGILANDKGAVFGDLTTGFELHRIEESLDLIK